MSVRLDAASAFGKSRGVCQHRKIDAQLTQDVSDKVDALCSRLGVDRVSLETTVGAILTLQERVAALKKEYDDTTVEMGILQRAFDLAMQDEEEAQRKLMSIDERLRAVEAEVGQLRGHVRDFEAALESAQSALRTVNAEFGAVCAAKRAKPRGKKKTELSNKHRELQQSNSRAISKCQELERELAAAQKLADTASRRLLELQARKEDAMRQKLPAQAADLERHLDNVELRRRDLQSRMAQYTDAMDSLIEQFAHDVIGDRDLLSQAQELMRRIRNGHSLNNLV